ncbi:MAG: DUF4190 domain-containing protein [Planctomycetota bacterium]
MDSVSQSQFNCHQCGYNLTGGVIGGSCPECGEPIESSLASQTVEATPGVAIASMVVGISGLLLIFVCGALALPAPIVAVVLGHMAYARFARQPALPGKGMALTGLITGYIALGLMLVFAAVMAVIFGAAAAGV